MEHTFFKNVALEIEKEFGSGFRAPVRTGKAVL